VSPKEHEPTWLPEYRGIARLRYDAENCALLLLRYYHWVPDYPEGLTFVREEAQATEKLVINSRASFVPCRVRSPAISPSFSSTLPGSGSNQAGILRGRE
jgi:hypothetical protein